MIRSAGLLAAVLAFSSPLLGQQNSTGQPSRPPSTSRMTPDASENRTDPSAQELVKLTARSDLVLVPVVVTDESGKHVSGLQKGAFRIEEDGKVRTVSIFEEIRTENPASRANASASEGNSNFLLGDDHAWRITIVVLDMINSPWVRQREAKRQLTDYLLRSVLRDQRMALFALTSQGIRQLHPFTRDTKVLIDALQKLKLSLSAQESTFAPDSLTPDPVEQEQASDEEQLLSDTLTEQDVALSANCQRIATRETLLAMNQLARAFQALAGRRTLLWASAGFPFIVDGSESFARMGGELDRTSPR